MVRLTDLLSKLSRFDEYCTRTESHSRDFIFALRIVKGVIFGGKFHMLTTHQTLFMLPMCGRQGDIGVNKYIYFLYIKKGAHTSQQLDQHLI